MTAPSPRRAEFEEIVSGWGSDGLDDLLARCAMLAAWWAAHMPLTFAEHKIASAMQARLKELGGVSPLRVGEDPPQ